MKKSNQVMGLAILSVVLFVLVIGGGIALGEWLFGHIDDRYFYILTIVTIVVMIAGIWLMTALPFWLMSCVVVAMRYRDEGEKMGGEKIRG